MSDPLVVVVAVFDTAGVGCGLAGWLGRVVAYAATESPTATRTAAMMVWIRFLVFMLCSWSVR